MAEAQAALAGRDGWDPAWPLVHYKRVIPCLDVNGGRVVKGVGFLDLRDAGDPVELAAATTPPAPTSWSSSTSRPPRTSATRWSSSRASRRRAVHPVHDRRRDPLGGRRPGGARRRRGQGVGQLGRARAARAAGRAGRHVRRPVRGAGDRRQAPTPSPPTRAGRLTWPAGGPPTGRDAVAWAREGEARGAGEILLTSMDRDGTNAGYDLPLTHAVAKAVGVPGDRLRRRRASCRT